MKICVLFMVGCVGLRYGSSQNDFDASFITRVVLGNSTVLEFPAQDIKHTAWQHKVLIDCSRGSRDTLVLRLYGSICCRWQGVAVVSSRCSHWYSPYYIHAWVEIRKHVKKILVWTQNPFIGRKWVSGSILVSIETQARLKLLCERIFGILTM